MAEGDVVKSKSGLPIRAAQYKNWNGDKFARMSIYVLLYNKIKDMPKGYGFGNNLTAPMVRDYIRDHFDELIAKFGLDSLPGLQFDSTEEKKLVDDGYGNPKRDAQGHLVYETKTNIGAGKKAFLAELDEYNQYALEVGKALGKDVKNQMPDAVEIANFMKEVRDNRSEQFEALRKSVKVEPGENYKDGKNKEGDLIQELQAKTYELREARRLMRRTGGKTGLFGLLTIGSAALTVASVALMFSPVSAVGIGALKITSTLGKIVVGLVGGFTGFAGFRSFGGTLFSCFGKLHGQHHKIEDIKNKQGLKKNRGLKEVEKHIEINRELVALFNEADLKPKDVKGNHLVKPVMKKVPVRDDNGKIVYEPVLDKDGNIQYEKVKDANGNEVIKMQKVQMRDPNGNLLFDSQHQPIYEQEVDSNGNPVFQNGQPVYKMEKVVLKQPKMKEIVYKYDIVSYEEFMDYVHRNHPKLLKYNDSEFVELKKTYGRIKEHFLANKGTLNTALEFVSHNQTTVISNDEIAIERDVEYRKYFGSGESSAEFSYGLNNNPNTPLSSEMSMIKSKGLGEFVNILTNFDMDKGAYEKSHEQLRYNNMKFNAAEMLPLAFQNEIFDKPYTVETKRNCTTLLNNEVVKKYLQANKTGDKTSYIKNALAFIELEATDKDPDMAIKQNKGWTIKQQLSMDATTIENACIGFGVVKGSSDYSKIEGIAEGLENMNYKEEANRLNGLLASVGNEKAREYLSTMISKRIKESGIGDSEITRRVNPDGSIDKDVVDMFIAAIHSLTLDKSTGEYFYMMNGQRKPFKDFNTDAATKFSDFNVEAIRIANEHIEAIERRNTNKIRAKAADAIRANSSSLDIEEMLNRINTLTMDKVADSTTLNMYNQEIYKIQPAELKEYITLKLQQKVERIYTTELSRSDLYKDLNALSDISKDMKLVGGLVYLKESQKINIMNLYGPHIERAFQRKIVFMQKHLLDSKENGNYQQLIEQYKNYDFADGGFKEFLQTKTKYAESVSAKLTQIANAMNIKDRFEASASGVSNSIDGESPETRLFFQLYFRTRDLKGTNEEALMVKLQQLKTFFSSELDFNNFTADGFNDSTKGQRIFDKMLGYLENDKTKSGGLTLSGGNNMAVADQDSIKDQIATLLIFKKNAITQFKAHLRKYIDPNFANPQGYIISKGAKTLQEISQQWEQIFKAIDDKYNELTGKVQFFNQYTQNGERYIPAMDTFRQAISSDKLFTFTRSDKSSFDGPQPGNY